LTEVVTPAVKKNTNRNTGFRVNPLRWWWWWGGGGGGGVGVGGGGGGDVGSTNHPHHLLGIVGENSGRTRNNNLDS